jgi:hypothetical protein
MTSKSIRTALLTALSAAIIAACAGSTASRGASTRSLASGLTLAVPTPAEGRSHETAYSAVMDPARQKTTARHRNR